MSRRPWMPFYIADYLADTQHLTTLQHGAYDLLIMHYWRHGRLPGDDTQLANIAKMSVSEWRRNKQTLAAFFLEGWRHKRIDDEIAKADAKHERRQAAGKRGGIAKSEAKQNPSNATNLLEQKSGNALASSSDSESQSERKKEEDTADAVSSSAKYFFESGIIRLNKKDFLQWKESFSHLDLKAELLSLTEWASTQPKWFFAVSSALAKRNREAMIAKSRVEKPKEFRTMSGMDGII